MKILNITGPAASGKTVAATMLINRFGGEYIVAETAENLRQRLTRRTEGFDSNNLAVDFQRKPSPALIKFVIERAEALGVEHLVLASTS